VSRGQHKGHHQDEIKMGQIPCEGLELHPSREGGVGTHDQDVVLPPHEGVDMRVLGERKHDIRAESKETIICRGEDKPQREDEEKDR
jgi:hypothetical protein